MNIGLILDPLNFSKIGDLITVTSIPENVLTSTGHRIVDLYNLWIYDHNPHVARGVKPDTYLNLFQNVEKLKRLYDGKRFTNQHQLYSLACGASISLGGPRLYLHESIAQRPKSLCVHVTPGNRDAKDDIPDSVIAQIRANYHDYTITQVGGGKDKPFPEAVDMRALPLWESVKVIASSEIFIGISSGPTHIADCYPRVRKKVLLFGSPQEVSAFKPYGEDFRGGDWINYHWEYYNIHEKDIGVTRSYRTI